MENGKGTCTDGVIGDLLKYGDELVIYSVWDCAIVLLRMMLIPEFCRTALFVPFYYGKGNIRV